MRIVVVGASGNVGSQVLEFLAGDAPDVELVGVARRPPTQGELADLAEWHAVDLADGDDDAAVPALTALFDGADAVIHLAWLIQPSHSPRTMEATNVDGSRRVLDAVRGAGVPALVVASSVGAYSSGPKDRRVEEDWPTGGIPTSIYSRHKVRLEQMLDAFESDVPGTRVVRIRPGVVVQGRAASEQARYFLGPFVPMPLIRRSLIPVVPALPRLALQVVHASDVAAAFGKAALNGAARGAYNVAGEPVLDVEQIANALRARPIPFSTTIARGIVDLTWRLRLQPTDVGWLDLALGVPLMSTEKAQRDLDWHPKVDARDAVLEAIEGIRTGRGGPSPVLRAVRGPLDQLVSGTRSLLPRSGGRI
jgi:nucleoside-diphosphate-sugar epimerase